METVVINFNVVHNKLGNYTNLGQVPGVHSEVLSPLAVAQLIATWQHCPNLDPRVLLDIIGNRLPLLGDLSGPSNRDDATVLFRSITATNVPNEKSLFQVDRVRADGHGADDLSTGKSVGGIPDFQFHGLGIARRIVSSVACSSRAGAN